MRLLELASLAGVAVPKGSEELEITGVASLQEARPGDITFFGNPRYLSQLRSSKASAAIVPADFSEELGLVLLRVENPPAVFAVAVAAFAPQEVPPVAGIHHSASVAASACIGEGVSVGPLAVIEEGAEIGDGSVIGSGCLIGRDVRLGRQCHLHPGSIIRERCILGDRVILQPGAVIGSCGFGYELKDGRHIKIPQTGIVEIGDDVEIGANATIDRARFGRTVIGEGSKIDNLVQIAHNVQIGAHSILCSQVGIAGSTRVGSYVTLAGQVGLAGHIEIGDKAVIGAQSGLSKNVPPESFVLGAPAKPIKEWKQSNFYISQLGKLYSRVKELERMLAERDETGNLRPE
jgi:UDP-3-O-[3-hydroxymyristoyl] glucosamine N-acyltransferase